MHGVAIAEDDELSRILDRAVAAAAQLALEYRAPDDAFDIAHLTPHDTAVAGGLRAEELAGATTDRTR